MQIEKKNVYTLRKLYFLFLSNWMGYVISDSFPFDFEPNGIPFGSKLSKGKSKFDSKSKVKSNGIWQFCISIFRTKWNSIWLKIERKLSPLLYPIQFEWKYSFLSTPVILRKILRHAFEQSSLGSCSKLAHFNRGVLTRIVRAILVKIPLWKCANEKQILLL